MNFETANLIKDISNRSIVDDVVLNKARDIIAGVSRGADIEELGNLLFEYSATLSATVATGVALVCLGEDKFDAMADDLMEHQINKFIEDIEKWENN
jgi:hypothetical protein